MVVFGLKDVTSVPVHFGSKDDRHRIANIKTTVVLTLDRNNRDLKLRLVARDVNITKAPQFSADKAANLRFVVAAYVHRDNERRSGSLRPPGPRQQDEERVRKRFTFHF